MKILCVIPGYYPAFAVGGPIFSVHSTNKALMLQGVDITVYTTTVGLSQEVIRNKEVIVEGVPVFYFSYSKLFEFFGSTGWQFSAPLNAALKRNLGAFDCVYIVSVWNYPSIAAALWCRKYGKPYVVSPRGQLYPFVLKKKRLKKMFYYHSIVKALLKAAAAIHYTTSDEAQQCHGLLKLENKAVVIPNGITVSEFSHLPSPEGLLVRYPRMRSKKVILFLGRIHWIKGLDILVEAFASLCSRRDDLVLFIGGDDEGPYGASIKALVRKFRLDERVIFSGFLSGEEKLFAYAASDVFVLPSHSENFGVAVVEALACGVPVIISDHVGIYQEIKMHEAGLVVPLRSECVSKAIELVLNDEAVRTRLIANGNELVRTQYDSKHSAALLAACFDYAMHPRR